MGLGFFYQCKAHLWVFLTQSVGISFALFYYAHNFQVSLILLSLLEEDAFCSVSAARFFPSSFIFAYVLYQRSLIQFFRCFHIPESSASPTVAIGISLYSYIPIS